MKPGRPGMTDERAAQMIARALADPRRYSIVKRLAQADAPVPCSAFLGCFPIAAPTFSHHMRELRNCGLIEERRTGRTMEYTLRIEVLEAFSGCSGARSSAAGRMISTDNSAPSSVPQPSIRWISNNSTAIKQRRTMAKLTGKVAVVTGASKGIGAGIAKALGAEGASVVVNYASDKAGADKTVQTITGAGGKAVAVQGSVDKAADVERLFADTEKAFGPADVLVNNAGVYEFAPLEQITEEHFHRHFNINVLGVLLASQAAARHFGERGGSIINIGSIVSDNQNPGATVYSATKGALDTITGVLAKELGPKKIRVNSVNPGFTSTEGNAHMRGGEMEAGAVAQTPLGRMGEPDDIADAVTFFASEDARWITGEQIRVSGGMR